MTSRDGLVMPELKLQTQRSLVKGCPCGDPVHAGIHQAGSLTPSLCACPRLFLGKYVFAVNHEYSPILMFSEYESQPQMEGDRDPGGWLIRLDGGIQGRHQHGDGRGDGEPLDMFIDVQGVSRIQE